MSYVDWVRLAGERRLLADVRADPDQHVRLLAAARSGRSAECLCCTPPLRLVTRYTQAGRHHLACWPGEGPRHHPRCAFHRVGLELSGRSAYSGAIRETAEGVSIRFAAPLISGTSEPQAAVSAAAYPALGRRSVGLTGLLHYLWESAHLSAWSAGSRPRSWAAVARALAEQVPSCTISRQPAERVLYVVPPFRAERAEANLAGFDEFMSRLRVDRRQIRRGFILGEIKACAQSKYGVRYQLSQLGRQRQVFVGSALDAKMRRSYRSAFSDAAAEAGGRRVVLFYVERSPAGFTVAADAAVMLTNRDFIPADSSYEVRMADALAAAGRSYIKPLAFDGAAGDAVTSSVFPDFVLTDEERAYVEVWGLPGREDYERRKAEKLALYQRTSSLLVEWTVTEPIPTLTRGFAG